MPEEIKKIELSDRLFFALAILVAGIFVFFLGESYIGFRNLPANYPREMTISAQGKAFAKPDIALIKFGLTSEGMKIDEVVKKNAEKMNAVLKEIRSLGIEEKDLETTKYNLSPRYEWTKEGQRIFKGYTLDQEVEVKIRNFQKIGVVIEKSTREGINLIGELSFTLDDPEKVKEKATEEAIEKAQAKARMITQKTGLKLVKVVNVYEEYYPTPIAYEEMGVLSKGGAITAAPEIEPGQEEIEVKINLVYQVR